MSRTTRSRRWPGALTRIAGTAGRRQQLPPGPPNPWAGDTLSADICAVDQLSFWRIVNIPYPAWTAALERWQLTRANSELRLGQGLLRGPIGHDRHFGTCQIEARLTRGPLRPPLRMRLDIDHWSPTATALTLIPCQRIRPGAAYFQAGRALLDTLTRTLPEHSPGPQLGGATARQPPAHPGQPRAVLAGGPPARSAAGRAAPARAQESVNAR